jgi:hypothetical protein
MVIILRDLRPENRGPDGTIPQLVIAEFDETDDTPDDYDFSELFVKFVGKALERLPLAPQDVDVYIGYWGNQVTFEIPQEFIDLIHETEWKVEFDLND